MEVLDISRSRPTPRLVAVVLPLAAAGAFVGSFGRRAGGGDLAERPRERGADDDPGTDVAVTGWLGDGVDP